VRTAAGKVQLADAVKFRAGSGAEDHLVPETGRSRHSGLVPLKVGFAAVGLISPPDPERTLGSQLPSHSQAI